MTSIQNHSATGNIKLDTPHHQEAVKQAPTSILRSVSSFNPKSASTNRAINDMREPAKGVNWGNNQTRIFSTEGRWDDAASQRTSSNNNTTSQPMRGRDSSAPRMPTRGGDTQPHSDNQPKIPTRGSD